MDNAVFQQPSSRMGSTIEGCNSGKDLLCAQTGRNVAGIPDPGTHGLPTIRRNVDPDCLTLFYKSNDFIYLICLMSVLISQS